MRLTGFALFLLHNPTILNLHFFPFFHNQIVIIPYVVLWPGQKKCQYTIDAKLGEFEGQNPPIAETYKIPRKLASHEPEEGRTEAFFVGGGGRVFFLQLNVSAKFLRIEK